MISTRAAVDSEKERARARAIVVGLHTLALRQLVSNVLNVS